MKRRLVLAALATAAGLAASAQTSDVRLEAFPGAEGYGRYTTGGRGGAVYHVTNLDDSGEGSFRWACGKSGKRTIVFDVSGTIMLQSQLKLSKGDVTIAGQTAPGDGICVANYPFVVSADNVIIRFMRFRLGNEAIKLNPTAHEGDGLGGMDRKNIILDHCSVSWSIDECLSLYGCKDFTVQWCIATHSLRNAGHSKGAHGYGGNWGGSGASYHHNLMANHTSRTPRLGPRPSTQTDERMDLRNNVIYNHGSNGVYGGEGMNVNIVYNYYKPGPSSNSRKARIAAPNIRTIDYCFKDDHKAANIAAFNSKFGTSISSFTLSYSGTGADQVIKVKAGSDTYDLILDYETYQHYIMVDGVRFNVTFNDWGKMLHKWGEYFVDGNYNPEDAAVTADNWTTGVYSQITPSNNDNYYDDAIKEQIKLNEPIEYVYTTTHTPAEAYERVLDYVGCSHARDEYDRMVIEDVRTPGTHAFGDNGIIDSQDQITYADSSTGWPKLTSTEAKTDTDGDGMPDEWETANGLDPNDKSDGAKATRYGWTNLEVYLNSLVQHIMDGGNKDGKMLNGILEYKDEAVPLPYYDAEGSGIESVTADGSAAVDMRIFDLLGREMREPLAPGVYIQGGRKFLRR